MNGFYGNLEPVVNKMAGMLLNNKDFIKYIYYSDPNPLSQPDIENPLSLLGKRFFLQPKPPIIEVNEGGFVEMIFSGDNPNNRNGGFQTNYVITFNILVHLNTWQINGGIRPFRIMNIIDSMFNGKKILEISSKSIIPMGSKEMKFSDEFYGYKVVYVLSWNGNADCY